MSFEPTEAQKDAIYTKGNILVSAAAGSGKTAVLVERVIKKLTDEENPTRADELLIVTFTNAAAAEMRSRIEKRMEEECRNNQDNPALILQKHLLNNAKICTIDSFCIDFVRENFEKLNISPDFKIVDETELKFIDEEVLYSIINRYLIEKNQDFYDLLNLIGAEYEEKDFAKFIFSIYKFSRQLPFPKKWYKEILESYNGGIFDKNNIFYKYAFQKAQAVIENMEKCLFKIIDLTYGVEIVKDDYLPILNNALEIIRSLKEKAAENDWDEFLRALHAYSLPEFPSVKGIRGLESVKLIKDNYKYLNGLALDPLYNIFYNDYDFINLQFSKIYPLICLFVNIIEEYEQKVFEAYKDNNVFTFHNTAHLALELLCDYNNGDVVVSENGREIVEQFKEIMVDEYQDTNDLQNMLFHVLSAYENKLFAVGDVKQSIYAFRGANPINFLNKKNEYIPIKIAKDNEKKKIILGNNFRSKNLICDFINSFFSIFMNESTGDIIYNDEEKLIPAAKFPDSNSPAVSFDFIDCSNTKENASVLEARSIAQYIREVINGEPCIKQDENTLRKADYGDFTILMRGIANKIRFIDELKSLGIPVNINLNSFAESIEVSTFLSLLKVIDNPKNDIALATVLLSPMFGFSPDELANIRLKERYNSLYSSLIFAADNSNVRARNFLTKLEEFRLKAVTLPIGKLVSTLLIDTEYLNIVSSMPMGEQRRNNLLLLNDLATQFVTQKNNSLGAFCEYILKVSAKSVPTNGGNSVNIMTMHSSKGLQFPICIVADIASSFNNVESRNSAVFSIKNGLGFKYYDEELKEKLTTLPFEVILDDNKSIQPQEELRLFYVAMTRAEDKLHFVGAFSNFKDKFIQTKNLIIDAEDTIDYNIISRVKSYAEWLLICLFINSDYSTLLASYPEKNIFKNDWIEIKISDGENLKAFEPEKKITDKNVNNEFTSLMKENFKFKYPFESLREIYSKISVSRLANKAESDKFAFTSKPSFMSKDGITSAGRGSAMHKVIEFFDFSKIDNIEDEIERLYEWQFISEDEKNSLSIKALNDFFESETFNRIKKAERVEREMRFLTEIDAAEIDNTLTGNLANEKVIVQGAVDICFIEDGELVILDFKTDRVDDMKQLSDTYSGQLNAYAKACEKIFNINVKEKIIYSFAKSDVISLL